MGHPVSESKGYGPFVFGCNRPAAAKRMRPKKNPLAIKPEFPKSPVWNYFDDLLDGLNVKCNLCAAKDIDIKYKVKDHSTTSLNGHIKANHTKEWADIVAARAKEKEKEDKAAEKVAKQQPKISEAVNKFTKVPMDGAKQEKYDKAVLELIGCNSLPFSLVDSDEYKSLVGLLDKTINLKHSTTVSRQMAKYCEGIKEDVNKVIKGGADAAIAFTTDIWTSRAHDSYISLTVHFIDKEFQLNFWTAQCRPFPEEHSGEQIRRVMEEEMLEELGISKDLPKWTVADNASNMVKAVRISDMEDFHCLNHTQQLAIMDSLKKFKDSQEMTMLDASNMCKRLAQHLHHGEPSRKLLIAECQATGHYPKSIPQANDTRWDSR